MYQPGAPSSIPADWFKKDGSAFTRDDVAMLLDLIDDLGHRCTENVVDHKLQITFYQDKSSERSAMLQFNEAKTSLHIAGIHGDVSKLTGVLMQFGLMHRP